MPTFTEVCGSANTAFPLIDKVHILFLNKCTIIIGSYLIKKNFLAANIRNIAQNVPLQY
jgi:hypothetical protein